MTRQEIIKQCLVDEKPIYWPEVGKLRVRSGMVKIEDVGKYDDCIATIGFDGGYEDRCWVKYVDAFATEQEARNELANRIDALILLREKRLTKLRKKAQEFRFAAETAKGE